MYVCNYKYTLSIFPFCSAYKQLHTNTKFSHEYKCDPVFASGECVLVNAYVHIAPNILISLRCLFWPTIIFLLPFYARLTFYYNEFPFLPSIIPLIFFLQCVFVLVASFTFYFFLPDSIAKYCFPYFFYFLI